MTRPALYIFNPQYKKVWTYNWVLSYIVHVLKNLNLILFITQPIARRSNYCTETDISSLILLFLTYFSVYSFHTYRYCLWHILSSFFSPSFPNPDSAEFDSALSGTASSFTLFHLLAWIEPISSVHNCHHSLPEHAWVSAVESVFLLACSCKCSAIASPSSSRV